MSTNKIKILEIEPVSDLGGVTQFIDGIVRYLPREEFDIHFAASGNGEAFNLFKKHAVTVHRIEIDYSFKTISSRIRSFKKFIQEEHVDIVHAHTVKAGLLAIIAAKRTGIKVIFTGHGWRYLQLNNPIKKLFIFTIERYIARHTNAVTYLTRRELEIGKKLAPQQLQFVIPMSLNLNIYQEKQDSFLIREEYGIPNEAFVVSMVGRLSYQKDPRTFIQVASKIINKIPTSYFVWAGGGDMTDEVQNLIEEKKLSKHVILLGQIDHDKIICLLQQSNAMLFTSRFEGLPIAILEAMTTKLPIVAAAVSGIPEIIKDGDTGLLYNKSDYMDAAEKILQLYTDSDKRITYTENAYNVVVSEYSPVQKCAEDFAIVYKQVYETNY